MTGTALKWPLIGLAALHGGLLLWALVGLAEMAFTTLPWSRISNPLFPPRILAIHWLSVLATASIFLVGYAVKWPGTPVAVACGYVAMAGVCFIETTQYLDHEGRWLAMGLEYATYLAIGFYLLRATYPQVYFGGTGGPAG